MLNTLLQEVEAKIQRQTETFTVRPYFSLRLALLCSFLVFITGGDVLVSVMVGFEKLSENTTWQFLQKQIESPLTARSSRELFHHTSKMVHRLFPPLLGKFCIDCSLKGIMYFMVLMEYLAGFLFFYFFSKLVSRISNPSLSFLLTLSICFTFLGKLFFWDATDGFALLGLLLAMSTRKTSVLFLALCMSFWTDERAIIASGLVFLWHGLVNIPSSGNPISVKDLLRFNKYQSVILVTIIFHFTVRFLLAQLYSMPPTVTLPQAIAEMKVVLIDHRTIELIPIVTFSTFEGWWLVLILSTLAITRLVGKGVFVFYVLCFTSSLLVSYMVDDITRSMVYAFPAVLIGFRWLWSILPEAQLKRLLTVVLVFNIFYPTYYLDHYVWPFFIRILKYSLIYGL
jgi:hypothetical protein